MAAPLEPLGASAAKLVAGDGFRDLFTARGGGREFVSILANVVLTY